MDYLESKSAPTVLRNHYEKLLFPYDVFQSGLMTGGDPNHEVKYNYVSKRKLGFYRTSKRRAKVLNTVVVSVVAKAQKVKLQVNK